MVLMVVVYFQLNKLVYILTGSSSSSSSKRTFSKLNSILFEILFDVDVTIGFDPSPFVTDNVCDLTLPPPPPPVEDEHECNLSRELTGDCDDVLLLVAGILFRLFIV
ncbi:hypothetical protein DERP_012237 [Dermatophagoides pteronyssinus]|uniref:Uncharacterized protein n=1 Tax=Dermatophagoides pteronyssinus TaxID=6956 RepID=A0ABQ8JFV2_DERPT|nr:hypothetical protein DERP_012237 [Dermatophagoides pteronyssinus]